MVFNLVVVLILGVILLQRLPQLSHPHRPSFAIQLLIARVKFSRVIVKLSISEDCLYLVAHSFQTIFVFVFQNMCAVKIHLMCAQ